MTKVASFEIHYTQFLDASGDAVAELPAFARDPAALIPLYRGDGADPALRCQGDRSAAHRAARHLCLLARPGSGHGRPRRGDAARGRAAADLSRGRRAALARRAPGRAAAVLGRRRARQRFRRARATTSRSPCRSRSQCLHAVGVAYAKKLQARAAVPRSASAAMARPRTAPSTRRSTTPAPGGCRRCS